MASPQTPPPRGRGFKTNKLSPPLSWERGIQGVRQRFEMGDLAD